MNDNNRMLLRYVAEGDIRKAQMQAKIILNSITAARDEQFKSNCLAKLNNAEPRFIELPFNMQGLLVAEDVSDFPEQRFLIRESEKAVIEKILKTRKASLKLKEGSSNSKRRRTRMREFEIKLYEPRGTVAEEHPEIASMWHPTANDCGPDEITCGSGRRIALICPRCGYGKNGEWRPVLSSVCRTKGGCPVCAGRIVVKGVNDVATVHPEIAEQWHPTLNTIQPDQITSGSGLHVYLVCKTCGYGQNGEWHPLLAFACGSGVNHTGCPQCARLNASHNRMKRIRKCTTKPIISVGYPQIAAMWHPTANKFRPDELTAGSGERIALVCPDCGYGKDEEWTPLLFTVCKYGPKCPACRKVRR